AWPAERAVSKMFPRFAAFPTCANKIAYLPTNGMPIDFSLITKYAKGSNVATSGACHYLSPSWIVGISKIWEQAMQSGFRCVFNFIRKIDAIRFFAPAQ